MPQWAGSSWYFLRYPDNKNEKEIISREKADKFLPVDMYVGGVEHAVLHLLYARFYTKFLKDIGVVGFEEPFSRLFNQGMIVKEGAKMSKSKGNVVSPDDLVNEYGCDSLRMYELFVGPPDMDAEWDDSGIDGVFRFITRLYRLCSENAGRGTELTKDMNRLRNRLIADISQRIENFSLNTVVSGFMEYTNKINELASKQGGVDDETMKTMSVLIAPFAPHIAEEIWEMLGGAESVFNERWPEADEEAMEEDSIEMVIQVNGKVRGKLSVPATAGKDEVIALAKETLGEKMPGDIKKEIFVPGKLVNIVGQ